MNKKDTDAIQVLMDLGLYDEPELSDEEQAIWNRIHGDDDQFLNDVEKLFVDKS